MDFQHSFGFLMHVGAGTCSEDRHTGCIMNKKQIRILHIKLPAISTSPLFANSYTSASANHFHTSPALHRCFIVMARSKQPPRKHSSTSAKPSKCHSKPGGKF